ncbi:MAG TPA: ATP-binding protein [Nocardioides sp.]|nr:ATP-binding protein [Nocardioides sp.]
MSSPASLAVQRRRVRVAAPSVVALCLLFAVLLSDAFTMPQRQAASGVGLLLAGILTAVSCGLRALQTTGKRRRTWRLFMGAAVVAVVGNFWTMATGADPVAAPSLVSEASIVVALLMSIAGLLSFPGIRLRGIDLLVMSLDGVVAAGAVLIMSTLLVYSRLLDSAAGANDVTNTLLFPLLDIVLVTVAVLLILRGRGPDRPILALVASGFVMYALADLAFSVMAEQDRFEFGTPLDLGWIAGYLLIALAAWYPSDLSDAPVHAADNGASDSRGTVVVFSVLLIAALVQVGFGKSGRLEGAQAVLWLVLLVATGARQALLAGDNAALRRGLERRVNDQTADLRRLARQTEVLLSSVGDGIYGVDHEGRVTFVNPSGARALGYEPHDLHGRSAHDMFHAPDAEGNPFPSEGCYVADAIREGRMATAEADVYVRADGTSFPVEITASPVVDDDRLRGAVVAFRDVTQRREVDRMKDEFLSVVSHELRTPLTSIRGSLGLLASGKLGDLTPRAGSMVTIALQSSERLTRLINDLLDIERIESGTRPMEVSAHDARQLLAAAAKQIDGLATSVGVRVEVGASTGRVLADDDGIMQTLTNLLGNAIKYSEPGGSVVLDAAEDEGLVLFRVRDQGRGIPADKLETVFERFEQVDSSDARQKGGTGLGLAISRSIIERHGGRIWAESELGVGTTVKFTLPSVRRRPADRHADVTRSTVGSRREVTSQILLVEDDEDLAGVVEALLADHGFDVVHATTASEAVALAPQLSVEAVILDLRLPDMDGSWAVKELRRLEHFANVPLVVYSAVEVEQQRRRGLSLGRTVFLTKGSTGARELTDRVVALTSASTGTREGSTLA